MRAIEFRYVVTFVQRMKDREPIREETKMKTFTIEEIEDDALDYWLRSELGTGYNTCEVLARQQYTGLQDAKGNKIFEGDLVTDEQDQILVTEFYNGAFCAKSKSGSMWPFSNYLLPYVNVIGNVYENKELLNEQVQS